MNEKKYFGGIPIGKEGVPFAELKEKGWIQTPEEWEAKQAMYTYDPRRQTYVLKGGKTPPIYDKAAGLDRSKVGTVKHLPVVLVAIFIGVLIYWLGRK